MVHSPSTALPSNAATSMQDQESVQKLDSASKTSSPKQSPSEEFLTLGGSGDLGLLTNCAADTIRDLSADSMMIPLEMSKVLIIYTGGTVGMKYSKKRGYTPAKDFLFNFLKSHPTFCDSTFHKENSYVHLQSDSQISDPIITPSSIYGKRTCMQLLEFSPLLDSSNMTMDQWVTIANSIETYYNHFDAFIVLHGTDTMAFTASALSFMLENLSKPVIFTGSQIPLSEMRNDGVENILGALTIAGHYLIPEVCIYFNNKLFRGNRCSKISAIDLDAFDSPNLKPLVTVNSQIEVDWNAILHPNPNSTVKFNKSLNPNVATIRLFPGIIASAVKAFVSPPIQGVVIEAFGSGNIPSNRPEILEILQEACQRGVVIVNCTQCKKGRVSEIYATARQLSKIGIVFGSDMTPECALTKLSYCLGNYSVEETRSLMSQDLHGELTVQSRPRFSMYPRNSFSFGTSKEEMIMVRQQMMNFLVCNAAGMNDLPTMKDLISSGASVNCSNYSKSTPLHIACAMGHLEMVQFLVANGANIHAKDCDDSLVLWEAAKKNFVEICALLFGKGARLYHGNEDTYVHFYNAVVAGDMEKVEWLLSLGINAERPNKFGLTAYDLAIKNNCTMMAEKLKAHCLVNNAGCSGGNVIQSE